MNKRVELEMTVQDHLGFIGILQEARANKLLARYNLNRTQFTVIFLLGADVREQWTLSDLTEHLEINAPGLSKIVTQLSDREWLKVTPDANDRRRKVIALTRKGRQKREQTLAAMTPSVSKTFAEWSDRELEVFCRQLEKLKIWLDNHRDDL